MYGFRKAISATTFNGQQVFGISLKSALIIAQVLGYMTSKFIGIKFISELNQAKRPQYILGLILSAHFSLLLLVLIPSPFNIIFLFTNGLCLGLIWGLVFSYIEGREFTDVLALILSVNFVFSSGVVKSIGLGVMNSWQLAEIQMPFIAGLLFLPLLFISVWMLEKIPPPKDEEIKSRGARVPLDKQQRLTLFKRFFVGLAAITAINLLLTILRDIKDNYAVEIVKAVFPSFRSAIFSKMETTAAIAVLFLLLFLARFKNHFKSIMAHHITILLGIFIILICSWALKNQLPHPILILITYSVGLYISYNTLQCLFLERFMAAFKINGNIGFLFYLMDAISYLGSCFIILNKELFNTKTDWLLYFIKISLFMSIAALACTLVSWFYFYKKYNSEKSVSIAS
jgi:Family of unknown function (DUF5690)